MFFCILKDNAGLIAGRAFIAFAGFHDLFQPSEQDEVARVYGGNVLTVGQAQDCSNNQHGRLQ